MKVTDYVRKLLAVVVLLISGVTFSCQQVPITGRSQLNLIPAPYINSMSFDYYNSFLKSSKLSTNKEQTAQVKRVGVRIQNAVTQYFVMNRMPGKLNGYKWEFRLIEDPAINAWCLPGGKVAVYTGIMPVAKDDNGLAVVIGHEIAHAVAEHGNERMSQGLLFDFGGMALSQALSQQPAATRELFVSAYGIGAQVGVLLPYSRIQETEADRLGLIFMTMAGYDPNAAVGFWERMLQTKKGSQPPEFLSTHPADQTRINNIKRFIPEAMRYKRG